MSATDPTPGDATVLRRPHFRLAGDELFFLISRRPFARLSASERALWEALDGGPTLEELRGRFPGEADPAVRRLTELGLCELASRYPAGRRRVVVFEPHSDDAVLSVGGTMWLRRHECEFHVVTLANRSNFTSYYELDREFFDAAEVTAIRDAEAALFARLLGGEHRTLGLHDAPLRYRGGDWSLDWFRRHRYSVAAFGTHLSSDADLRAWTDAIRAALNGLRGEEVWFPLGSPHTDHELARNAFLSALADDPTFLENRAVRLYQEVPYAARYPRFTRTVVDTLTRQGARLAPEVVPVTDAFADKLRLVSLYGSQFKLEAMRQDLEASGRDAADGDGLAERFWRLERLPRDVEPLSFYADDTDVIDAARRLAPWVRRHRNADRIRLLLLVAAGRWAEDMEALLRAFPEAQIEAIVAPAAAPEVVEAGSPRVQVQHVDAGTRAWLRLALRLAVSRPMPTLFLAGQKRLRESRWLSRLWPMSDPVVLPAMNHLTLGLRRLAAGETRDRAGATV